LPTQRLLIGTNSLRGTPVYSWRGRPILYSGSLIIPATARSSYRARQRKDAGEHRHRDAERALHDPRIEIDVRVELALDEIFVLERDLLQRERELEEAIVVQTELLQDLMAGLAA